jgi:hypothetical protein
MTTMSNATTTNAPLVRRGNGKAIHYAALNKGQPVTTWCATGVLTGGMKDSALTVLPDATEATCKACLRAAAEVQHVEPASSKGADASKGKPATSTKGKGSKVVSKPAGPGPVKPSEAKKAAREASPSGVVKRIAPQLVGYTEGRKVDEALAAALRKGIVDNQQAVWIPVTVETCERLLAFGRAVLDDDDTTAGARRTAAAMIRRVESYTLPEAGKATA